MLAGFGQGPGSLWMQGLSRVVDSGGGGGSGGGSLLLLQQRQSLTGNIGSAPQGPQREDAAQEGAQQQRETAARRWGPLRLGGAHSRL